MSLSTPTANISQPKPLFDYLGAAATSLCVAHCMAIPLLAQLAVAWGIPALTDHSTEQVLLIATLAFACIVTFIGCRRHHGKYSPLALTAIGGACYFLKGAFGEAMEPAMVIAGGIAIVAAHAINLRLCKQCRDLN